MLTSYNSILTFNKIKLFGLCLIVLAFSCEDADYDLDNPYDPSNMDLDPPALFFHPPEVSTSLGESISVEVYGLKLDSSAGAHFDIRYDWGSVTVDSVVPGPFFTGLHPEVLPKHRKNHVPCNRTKTMRQGLIARRLTS